MTAEGHAAKLASQDKTDARHKGKRNVASAARQDVARAQLRTQEGIKSDAADADATTVSLGEEDQA